MEHYKEFLIILGAAALVVPMFLRIGISAVLAFLLIGILLSPNILGQVAMHQPYLQALVIAHPESIAALGELGVVFLLFLIGLELSFERLNIMRKLVFGLGGLQVVLSLTLIAFIAYELGVPADVSLVVAGALSLSSTAIVVQLLSDAKRLGSQTGRASFAVLLLQDLAVIPLLLLVTILSRGGEQTMMIDILTALAQAGLAILFIILAGRYALRPLLRMAAGANSPDLFLAATLLVTVGTAALANAFGLSMGLGAFVAGLILAETEYRRAIEAIIEPFKGLLLGTFFLLVGLGFNFDGLLAHPYRIISIAIGVILLKGLIVYGLGLLFRLPRAAALESAFLLAPCGEFAFVIVSTALARGLLDPEIARDVQVVVTITMIATPLLAKLGNTMAQRVKRSQPLPPELAVPIAPESGADVIITGFGRVGHMLASMLDEHNIKFIAVDNDAAVVARERKIRSNVYFGDAGNPEFLKACGIETAKALAVTMESGARVEEVTRIARGIRSDLKIIARARDERHAIKLYSHGVTEAVPETVESSLQLGEALLVESGIPIGLAIASVHERRDEFRKLLGRPNRRDELEASRTRARRRKAMPKAN